ncbi:hypothetical protein [Azospirillum thermophilum]|uniref:Uncharacterized protein n=1 Tax=Azospirillum thermophilum TaxID=2202148 RepID=A0A2S2CUC0_9PROT|nr:hypothetical protein [Azospirillum thermophilum]AWK88102.1 hypothetical protein DEW08_18405 [Azospirillum thermophilum]
MTEARVAGGRAAVGPDGLDLHRAFDSRPTAFTEAVESLTVLLADPPSGPYGFDQLSGAIRELSARMIRCLPLTTVRDAQLAQSISLAQIVDESVALALGQAAVAFLGALQAAAERAGLTRPACPAAQEDASPSLRRPAPR